MCMTVNFLTNLSVQWSLFLYVPLSHNFLGSILWVLLSLSGVVEVHVEVVLGVVVSMDCVVRVVLRVVEVVLVGIPEVVLLWWLRY